MTLGDTAGALTAVFGTEPDNVFIAGEGKTLWRFDGSRWREVGPGTDAPYWFDLFGCGTDEVFALLGYGSVWVFDGGTLQFQPMYEPGWNEIPQSQFSSCSAPDDLWLVDSCRTDTGDSGLVDDIWPNPGFPRTASSCEEAMLLECPALVEATVEEKTEACTLHMACYSLIEESSCIERIPRSCIFCTLEADEAGQGNCDSAAFESCMPECTELVVPPATAQECKDMAQVLGFRNAAVECFCDECSDAAFECVADPGCVEIVKCVDRTDCRDSDCYQPETCKEILDKWRLGSSSVDKVNRLAECDAVPDCAALN